MKKMMISLILSSLILLSVACGGEFAPGAFEGMGYVIVIFLIAHIIKVGCISAFVSFVICTIKIGGIPKELRKTFLIAFFITFAIIFIPAIGF